MKTLSGSFRPVGLLLAIATGFVFSCSSQAPISRPSASSKGHNNVVVGTNNGIIIQSNISVYPRDKTLYRKAIDTVRGSVAQVKLMLAPSSFDPALLAKIPSDLNGLRGGGGIVLGTALLINDDGDFLTAGQVGRTAMYTANRLKSLGIEVWVMLALVGANGENRGSIAVFDSFDVEVREMFFLDRYDLAVLKSSHEFLKVTTGINGRKNSYLHTPLKFLVEKSPAGENVFACGFPDGQDLVFTWGHIASGEAYQQVTQSSDIINVYKVELRTSSGDIGGPVMREADQAVTGILVRRSGSDGDIGIAVPAKLITEYLTSEKIKWTGVANALPSHLRGKPHAHRRSGGL